MTKKVDIEMVRMAWRMYQAFSLGRKEVIRFTSDFLGVEDDAAISSMFKGFEKPAQEAEYPDVLQIMRDALMDKAFAEKDEALFKKLSAPGWERVVMGQDDELADPAKLRRLTAYENGETLLPWQEAATKNTGIQAGGAKATAPAKNRGLGAPKSLEPEVSPSTPLTGRPTNHAAPVNTPTCPICGQPTIRRQGRYGHFYGCSAYPSCRGTVSD